MQSSGVSILLREITDSMFPEASKLAHLGVRLMPRRSTLSDANARRPECIFETIYRDLYATYKHLLSSDSRKRQTPKWLEKLQVLDSTTVSLFSNLIFKGVGRHPKTGKKKGGIKVHTNIHANEGVPSDIKFTSEATNDSFMLKPSNYDSGTILAIDRAYIDYGKFEELTQRGVIYVTKMKKTGRKWLPKCRNSLLNLRFLTSGGLTLKKDIRNGCLWALRTDDSM